MKHLFYKGAIDKRNGKALFEFLITHYTYYTMNSWNGLESIANNVKIYELGLEGDKWLALGLLENDSYTSLNNMIYDWEDKHPNYEVGFNGRSGGYLVLTSKENNDNILPRWIRDCDNYEEFKTNVKDYYGTIKEALPDLIYYVELVQDFDKLCDEIRDYVNELSLTNKDSLIKEKVQEFVNEFNETYINDMKVWNIKPLEFKDGKIVITDVYKSKSLGEALDNSLVIFNSPQSPIQVSKLPHNGIIYLEFKI